MSKAPTAIVSLLMIALAGVHRLPGYGQAFLHRSFSHASKLLKFACSAVLVLLVPAILCASFGTVFRGLISTVSTGAISLSAPGDLVVDSLGNTYIADTGNQQIVEVTAAGVASVVSFPGLIPALGSPSAVAVDGSANLYVADSSNSRVVKLAAGIASVVDTASLLTNPSGVALDPAGDLFIADATNNYIVEVTPAGAAAVLTITGLSPALSQPSGLGFDVNGNLYIADKLNSRIVEVTPGGVGSALSITSGLTLGQPSGVRVDGFGNVYIADAPNNRIVIVFPGGASTDVVATASLTLVNPKGVAVTFAGAIYIADTGNSRVVEAQDSSVGFGRLPLGTASGTILPLPFSVAIGTTMGSVQAFTQGTPNLDFSVVTAGTTCISGTTGTMSCIVNVQFLPTAPGLRRGSVVLYDECLNPLVTVPLYAFADAPLAALSPGAASVISTGGVPATTPFQITEDGAGNMYLANYEGNNVLMIPPGGGSATVVSLGSETPSEVAGVAIDGAGDLFITDHFNSRILEIPAGGTASVLGITGLSLGLDIPTGLTVDAAGNLYISDYGNGRVVKVTPSGAGSVVGMGSFTPAMDSVLGVAVDAAGTVYFSDAENNRVIKVTAAGAASLVVPEGITPALSSPQGVAVDGFGNLYIGDAGNDRLVRITSAGVASIVPTPGLTSPSTLGTFYALAADASGNILVPDFSNSRLVEVNLSGAALAFPNTGVGSTSSPKTVTVTNIGDLPLIFADNPAYTPNFSENTGDMNLCALGTPLAAGEVCDVSVEFTPQSMGSLNTSIVVTDNNLNLSNATESVAVSGTGLITATSAALTAAPNPATAGQSVTLTATVSPAPTGSPLGTVSFYNGETLLGSGTINSSGVATLSLTTLPAGADSLTAVYSGNTGFATSTSSVFAETVTPVTSTTTALAPAPNPATAGQSVTLTATVSPVPTGSPLGTVSFFNGETLLGSGSLNSSGVATLSIATLPAGADGLTAVYSGNVGFATSTSTAITETINPATTANTTTVTASPSPAVFGQSVTITATISPAPTGNPLGSVSFFNGATLLGTGSVNSSGVAAFVIASLPAGGDSITAVYSGNAAFAPSTSSAITETVTPAYVVMAPATPFIVAQGGAVVVNVNVPPLGGAFTNVVTMSASGLPPGATATFNPPMVTPGAAGAPTVLTIQLLSGTAVNPPRDRMPAIPFAPLSAAATLCCILFVYRRPAKGILRGAFVIVSLLLVGAFLSACNGGFASNAGTLPGSYVITITGTSGNLHPSTTVTLNIQ